MAIAIMRTTTRSSHLEFRMNPKEQRIMAAIFIAAAIYLFEWKALLLLGIGGLIYWILRNRS